MSSSGVHRLFGSAKIINGEHLALEKFLRILKVFKADE